MIRFVRPAIAASVQDRGRVGHRAHGHARSGAMDLHSLAAANTLAGAPLDAAAIELGPGPCEIEVERDVVCAFAGAERDGAPWWRTIEARRGRRFVLSTARPGVWSYLAVRGGVDAPVVLGSRSTCVREGIGAWLRAGDVVRARDDALEPAPVDPLEMSGAVRVFGSLPGEWRVGRRADRMGYTLEGAQVRGGPASEWSEPVLPGFVQIPPGGTPIVLMTEGPTVGGYPVAAIVHSEDLRLVAQSAPGSSIHFRNESQRE